MTYSNEIISKIAYLVGIDESKFNQDENENAFASKEIFDYLETIRAAKIVRSLCIMRNGILNNFSRIIAAIQGINGFSSGIHGVYEFVGEDNVEFLASVGIRFKYTAKATRARDYIVEINKHIKDRINNCRPLFPEYIEWELLRDLFVMPDGLTDEGCKIEGEKFVANKTCYPFSCYMHWKRLDEERGKALFNDYFFLNSLYVDNGLTFDRMELVTNNSENNYNTLKNFIVNAETEIVVDCENANPFFIYALLNNLGEENYKQISKIVLFNDQNASSAWKFLKSKFKAIDFEEIFCERVLDRKSLVDVHLIARTVKDYCISGIRSFIVVSSDSDFCGMIQELEEAKFMFVLERHQTSHKMIDEVERKGVAYIYAEDYDYSDVYDFKKTVIVADVKNEIQAYWQTIDLDSVVTRISENVFAELSDKEKAAILQCISKRLKIEVSNTYEVQVVIE